MVMGRFLFADLPDSAPKAVREFYELWRDKRRIAQMRRGEIPHFRDFENRELLPYEQHLAISTYCDAREDAFIETSGAMVIEAFGVDLSGKWVSEVFDGAKRALAQRPYRAAARVGRPTYSATLIDQTAEIVSIILPLRSESSGVAFLSVFVRAKSYFNSLQQHSFLQGSDFERRSFLILKTDLMLPVEKGRAMFRVLRRVESPSKERRRRAIEAECGAA